MDLGSLREHLSGQHLYFLVMGTSLQIDKDTEKQEHHHFQVDFVLES
jgi:hypothetical protein